MFQGHFVPQPHSFQKLIPNFFPTNLLIVRFESQCPHNLAAVEHFGLSEESETFEKPNRNAVGISPVMGLNLTRMASLYFIPVVAFIFHCILS